MKKIVVLINNSNKFLVTQALATDMALGHMGQDTEIIIKTGGRTPFAKTGFLRNQTRHEKLAPFKWRVIAPVEYAAVQEAGRRAGGKFFKHYTTPGTGRGWFKAAVDTVMKNRDQYMREAIAAVRL